MQHTFYIKRINNKGQYEGYVRRSKLLPRIRKLFTEELILAKGTFQISFIDDQIDIVLTGDIALYNEQGKMTQMLLQTQVNTEEIMNAIDTYANNTGWYDLLEMER